MCPISLPAVREKRIMTMDEFKGVVNALAPYQDSITMIDLYGLSEPLADPLLIERIKYLKLYDFGSVGISTNAQLLNEERARSLFRAGLNNIILSIDGINPETHNRIRKRTDLSRIVRNVNAAIKIRANEQYETRFVIRFIRQEGNAEEWPEFARFWSKKLSSRHGDFITAFDVHTHGGEVKASESSGGLTIAQKRAIDQEPCSVINDVLYILADGSVPLCSEDWYQAKFNMGSAFETDPVILFNSKLMNKVREIHRHKNKVQIEKCAACTIHYGHATKQVVLPNES